MHAHDHHHGPSHGTAGLESRGRLGVVLGLSATYMLAEIAGAWLTGSLALLADAGHTLSDAAALSLTLGAIWLANRPATTHRTYGHSRAEILAALVHGGALVGLVFMIVYEAIERLGAAQEAPLGVGMMVVATGGLAVNAIGMKLLDDDRHGNLNVRGAWLHLLTDALGSMGVIVAGFAIWAFDWRWADPVASLAIAGLVLVSAWGLLRDAVDVLMETAPRHLDLDEIRDSLTAVQAAQDVHDLHVWTIGNGEVALSTHVVTPSGVDHARLLVELNDVLRERFAIVHATIQIEPGDAAEAACVGCEPSRVSAGT